jgi:enoyl-CoA hydratase
MEAVLTGGNIDVEEAEKWGITAKRLDTPEACVDGALDTAELIAGYSTRRIAVKAAKEAVNVSEETSLAEGVRFEKRVFHGLFATKDQKIDMKAFVEKASKPEWKHE